MKLSLIQCCLAMIFVGVSLAKDVNAQDILNKKISIHLEKQNFENVLSNLEKQADVKFTYRPRLFVKTQKITLNINNETLGEVLNKVFTPLNIHYKVINNQVVLSRLTALNEPNDANILKPSFQVEESFSAEDITIKGTVSDDKGEKLPGVNVTLKGTTRGSTTNTNGEYSIAVPDNKAVLVFSFIGYTSNEVKVGNQSIINVTLETDIKSLSEVVVIGYGTQRKSDLTGAVASVDPKKLEGLPLTDVAQALQGQVSGVKVRRNSGDPGGNFSVYIRGVNSTASGSQPLFVVDGVPLASNSINTLNPDEIESIDVLKDASSAAIYGARAANGVVLVTTKMGKKGQPTKVSFDIENGMQTPILPFEMTNSTEMYEIARESYNSTNTAIPAEWNDPTWLAASNNDWLKLGSRNAMTSKYNLQITGGNEKTQFMVGGSYLNNEGVVLATFNKNATIRLNLDHEVNSKFKIGSRISGGYNYGSDFRQGTPFESPWRTAAIQRPTPHKDASGNYPQITTAQRTGPLNGATDNPIALLEEEERYTTQYSVLANLFGEYEIIKGLKLKYLGGAEYFSNKFYDLNPIYDRGAYNRTAISLVDNLSTNVTWLSDFTLTYDKQFNDHHITALGGLSAQKTNFSAVNVQASGATSNALNQVDGQTTYAVGGLPSEVGLYSYFGRLFYSYKDRYLLTSTLRRDGSSRFGPENQFGIFPSASVGWLVSEENFLKNSKLIDNLKLRASYGLTGNQEIGNFRYLNIAGVFNYINGNAIVPGFSVNSPANPAIQWESQNQLDLGLDVGFFKNRLAITADYYQKTSNGLLTDIQLAPSTGFVGALTKNVGKVENKGWELGINSVNTTGNLKWNTSFNISGNKNNVVDLGLDNQGKPVRLNGIAFGNPIGSNPNVTAQGQPISSFYGFIFDGIFQTNEADAAKLRDLLFQPGDIKYRDLNGDGKITADDRTFLGSPHPTLYGGLTNTFSYKGLSLSIFADFATGHKVFNGQRLFAESGNWNIWQAKTMTQRWTPTNPSNLYPRSHNGIVLRNNLAVSSRVLEPGDFLRLSNVTFGYQIPKNVVEILKLKAVNVSFSINNLHTWTKYSGWNPETSSRDEPLSQGLDFGSYPLNRSFIGRVNIQF